MKKVQVTTLAMLFASAAVISSCGGNEKQSETEANEAPAVEEAAPAAEEPSAAAEEEVTDDAAIAAGEAAFTTKCVACHQWETKGVGPAMSGVTERRTDEWIIKMITNPTEMLANDEDAKALLAEYNNVPMANLGISEEEANSILAYFKSKDAQ